MRSSLVAFIPARAGSKRIPDKNVKVLGSHPLLAYAIRGAIQSRVFDAVVCVTDNARYAEVARYYGAEVPCLRPSEISGDMSPDIEWVSWILDKLAIVGRKYECFSILRPTSPFRSSESIQAAWRIFSECSDADSLRAVERCTQHPGKMWVCRGKRILPLLPFLNGTTPWHSSQYASLPEVFVQNASLEIAWTEVVLSHGTIAGENIIPFITPGLEGFDINDPNDWLLAEHFLEAGQGALPEVNIPSFENSQTQSPD